MNLNYYTSKKKYNKNILFGFFTKNNYNSLSLKDNFDKSKKQLCLKKHSLKILNQKHTNKVITLNKKILKLEIEGDGIITKEKNIAIGIMTADCAPIFIFDSDSSFICCLHSGWKGCLLNIVDSAFNKIRKIQKSNEKIYAIIGPCLNKKNFEVSLDFRKSFITKNTEYDKYFRINSVNKKYYFDMRGLINFQLKNIGLKNIDNINLDTYENRELFHSHRRSFHEKSLPAGRMINIIGFNPIIDK